MRSLAVALALSLSLRAGARAEPRSALAEARPGSTAASERRWAPRVDRVSQLLARGDAARARGDSLSALGYFRDAVAAAPRRGEGYVALGSYYLELDEPLRALEVFQVGVRSAAPSQALWLGLSRAQRAVGNTRAALDALRALRDGEPSSLAGLRALASLCEEQGAFLEALSARRALLDQLSDEAERANERAHVRALEHLLGQAERVRRRAVCDEGEPDLVLHALARCP